MSKRNIKKITALACAGAFMAQLTACGENTTWGAEAGGVQIPAGVFIYYLQNAYYNAGTKLSEETGAETDDNTDILSAQIEGKTGSAWITDEATESMKEYAAVNSKFDEYGLVLSDETKKSTELYCDQIWDMGGEYYTEMGISQKSYESIFLNSDKKDMLFDKIYGEGGESYVPDDEIKSYLDENYVMINYIDMELKDGEGNLLKSEGKEERRRMAEEYIERYKNGESFDALNAEYTDYYQKLRDDAAAAAAETVEDSEETVTEAAAETEAQAQASDAEAPLGGDGDTLDDEQTSDDGSEEETETAENADEDAENADENNENPDDEEAADSEAADESSEDNYADEENSAESAPTDEEGGTDADGEESGESTDPAEDNTSDEDTSSDNEQSEDDGSVSTDDVDVSSVPSNQTVINRESTSPAAEVTEAAFEMEKGELRIVESENGEHYYLVLKMDVIETDEYFNAAKSSLLYEMKEDDFNALITSWADEIGFTKNPDAYERYSPEKLFAS